MNRFLMIVFLLFYYQTFSIADEVTYKPQYSDHSSFEKKVFTFGVHPLHNPKRLFAVYQPMVDFINEHFTNIEIKLEASRNYDSYNKKLFSGYYDLSLPNPYQTVLAAKLGYKIFGKMSDDANFRGIIIVRKDSNIEEVKDLKGKTISYPAPTALAATMLPQYFLYKNGLNINKDIKNSYVGSQESSIMNVYLKKSSASSTWPPPWKAFMKHKPKIAKELKVIWNTQSLPNNGLVAKKDFPKDILKQISKIIFSLHTHERGKNILKDMELSKYEKANDATYNKVRDFLKEFDKNVRKIKL